MPAHAVWQIYYLYAAGNQITCLPNLPSSLKYTDINTTVCSSPCITGTTAVNAAQNNTLAATVYPNPATDNLTISTPSPGFDVAIYDALGSTVYTNSVAASQYSLPTGSFKKGMYMVVVTLGDNSSTTKVVIEWRDN